MAVVTRQNVIDKWEALSGGQKRPLVGTKLILCCVKSVPWASTYDLVTVTGAVAGVDLPPEECWAVWQQGESDSAFYDAGFETKFHSV